VLVLGAAAHVEGGRDHLAARVPGALVDTAVAVGVALADLIEGDQLATERELVLGRSCWWYGRWWCGIWRGGERRAEHELHGDDDPRAARKPGAGAKPKKVAHGFAFPVAASSWRSRWALQSSSSIKRTRSRSWSWKAWAASSVASSS